MVGGGVVVGWFFFALP